MEEQMEHQMKKVDGSSLIVALGPSLIAWLGLKLGISDDIADGKFDDEKDGLVLCTFHRQSMIVETGL